MILRSNAIAPDPRVERTARALQEAAYSVTVVGWDRTGRAASLVERDFGAIHRLAIRADFGSGLQNLPALLRFQVGLLRWLISNRRRYDVIHACDFDTVLPALMLKGMAKKRLVYDIFDFYADHLRATPEVIKRAIRRFDLRAVGMADAVILADDARRAQVAAGKPRRLAVIYNSPFDLSKHGAAEAPIPADEGDGFQIVYVGLLQVERGLLELLEVMAHHPDWQLALAGFGGDEDHISRAARRSGNVKFHGRIAYQPALRLMAAGDALVATYDPSIANHRFSSPNKLFEAMMLGKPIVVAEGTNIDRLVREIGCGTVVQYGDLHSLDGALSSLASDPDLRRRMGAAGREAYETRYNWDVMGQRLMLLYESL